MKKILFIVVPSITKEAMLTTGQTANRVELNPPYGPLSIISYTKKHADIKVEFEIIDLKLLSWNVLKEGKKEEDLVYHLANRIKEINPDIIAISALYSLCYNHLHWLEKAIENAGGHAVTVIGGSLAAGSYEEVLRDIPAIGIACYGEGELPFVALVEADDPMQAYLSSPALITRESLSKGIRPKAQRVEDLDDIPQYDFSYIDLDKYSGIQYHDDRERSKSIEVITSRGCPYNCIFCSCHLMYGKRIRYHSAERVCSDISRYVAMGYKTIRFYDENFFFKKERAISILSFIGELQDKDIIIEFPNGMMTARIDDEMAMYVKKAGLRLANLAVESGSEYVLKRIIQKPVSKTQVLQAVDALKKQDIDITLFIVTGFPGETDEHRSETVSFLKELNVDWAQILVATPFKGSRLYDICVENNYLYNYDITNISMRECHIKTPDYEPEYIDHIAYKMNLEINFIGNFNLRRGNYNKALRWFNDVIGKFPSHAIAHYCASICYEKLGNACEAAHQKDVFRNIVDSDPFWYNFAKEFVLI